MSNKKKTKHSSILPQFHVNIKIPKIMPYTKRASSIYQWRHEHLNGDTNSHVTWIFFLNKKKVVQSQSLTITMLTNTISAVALFLACFKFRFFGELFFSRVMMPHRKYIVCLSLSRFHKFFFLRSLPSIQQNFFFSEYKEPTTAQHRNALMLFWNWIKKKLRGLRESHEKVTHTITQVLSHRKKSPLRIANGFQRRQWRFVVKRIFVLCLSVIPGSLCNAMRKRENCSCVWVFVCIIVTGKISFRVLSKAPSSQQSFEKYTDFPPPHFFFFCCVFYFSWFFSRLLCQLSWLYIYFYPVYRLCVLCLYFRFFYRQQHIARSFLFVLLWYCSGAVDIIFS